MTGKKTEKPPKPVRHSQGGLVIWHGMRVSDFRKLIKVGADIHWSQAHRIIPTLFMTLFNSVANVAEKALFSKRIEKTEIQPPIFVLGHWRSGTTMLHNLMTLDDRFTYPNLYKCIFPHHCLTTETVMSKLTGWMIAKNRPMDNMKSGWNLPQEDEFALLLMTTYSPYRMLAFQGHPERYIDYFDLQNIPEKEFQAWKEALIRFMKKVTISNPKPIILKSPTHTFRVKILQEMFPGAKFVYIYRDPYKVLRSTLHLRSTMFQTNALGRVNMESHEELVYQAYENCIHKYEQDKLDIPEGNLCEIKYEDLEKDVSGSMQQIYEKLGLPDYSHVQSKIDTYAATIKDYKKNEFPTDPELAEIVNKRMKFALELYGYEPVD